MRPTSNRPRAFGACVLRATAYATIGSRMPTKTSSRSRISRAATAIISSCDVYASLIGEVHGLGRPVAGDEDRIDFDHRHVRLAIGRVENPALEPRLVALARSRFGRVGVVKRVVALPESLHRRWMRAARLVHDSDHLRLRQQDAIRIAQLHRWVHQLLARDDHPLGCQPRLLTYSERTPCMRAALRVAALDVEDGHVGP